MERIEDRLAALVRDALAALGGEGVEVVLDAPRVRAHGDFSTNAAMRLAATTGRVPRDVAAELVAALPASPYVERAEVAGPGFVNFFLTPAWLHEAVRAALAEGADYGRAPRNGRSVQVEFVSANPTGPLHLGHARNAAIGDGLASLLDAAGWRVEREYYFNDAGLQMERFGATVEARYLQRFGRPAEVPEDGYPGEYVVDVAADIARVHGDALLGLPAEERVARLRTEGAERVLAMIRSSLDRFGVRYDSYVSEREFHEAGEIEAAIARMRERGHVYDADGAVFFRSTDFGDDKDRVLVRSNGAPTYFAADCAYLGRKFARGFDRLIYVWGADHHGDVARVRGAASALGHDPDALEMILYQWVSLVRDGEAVAMSKRGGTFVTLDDLLDEIGTDAARFLLLSRSGDSPIEIDLELAARQTMDNPVFYVQYAHARIASMLRTAAERGVEAGDLADADLSLLATEAEVDLMRRIAELPGEVLVAADLRAPHRIVHHVQAVAAAFHRFYADCRVVGEAPPLAAARLWLARAAKVAIANALGIVGVAAPESMERLDAD
jgi:arginyl-tRNA synthetase